MRIHDYMMAHGHEQLSFFTDPESGLRLIIGIHDTTLGPALGGARMYPYESEAVAVLDVLRLSEGMSYKAAMAGLALGGGKCVIIGDPRTDKSPALFHALGRAVDALGGRYITAEDVGTTVADLVEARSVSRWVSGLPESLGGGGDPSPVTAVGVLSGMEAAAEATWGDDSLAGRRVAIQGVGKVGYRLAELLHERGAQLIVTDVNGAALERARRELGATVVPLDGIYDVEADIFAPCALGATLNDQSIPRLTCRVVAGSANNQLAEPHHGAALRARGILYAPDYVVNAGGVINISVELDPAGYDPAVALERVRAIRHTVAEVIAHARTEGIPTSEAADQMARRRLAAGGRVALPMAK